MRPDFPTKEQVEKATHEELGRWFRFLPEGDTLPFRNQRTAEQHRHPFLSERNPSVRLCAQGYQKMSCFCEIGGLGMINQPMMQSIQSKF
jgi:hypothetical protein